MITTSCKGVFNFRTDKAKSPVWNSQLQQTATKTHNYII